MARKPSKTRTVAEFGDFQTPLALASRVGRLLAARGLSPRSIIEPTCGRGAFLLAAAAAFPAAERILGFEINPAHLAAARTATDGLGTPIALEQSDFFATDWDRIVDVRKGPWLIVGNPPWVTSAELGALSSSNLPTKNNFQGRKGLDAITGKANFDISEWMLLEYLRWLRGSTGAIAVLCKVSVARKVLAQAWRASESVQLAEMFRIDALGEFGAAVDACLLVVRIGPSAGRQECRLYADLDSEQPVQVLGFDGQQLIADAALFERHRGLQAVDPKYVWRSGIKHDCSKVMELRPLGTAYENGFGEAVWIEPDLVYPMLKSSDLGNGRLASRGVMVVPQTAVGRQTAGIQAAYPLAWDYLSRYGSLLDGRGSSIYRKAPRFSIFGVGGYTFAPWKVAISGFYKGLNFQIVGPQNGRPVVFDDTVYFLSCSSEQEALFVHGLLTSPPAQQFLQSVIHWDEKRPITVSVLKRLSLRKVAEHLGRVAEYESFAGSTAFSMAA